MTVAARLRVTGVVQGVGFRPFVYNLARDLALTGWVNNASDGVHCVVEGEPDAVERFARTVAELAPIQAVVESVEVTTTEPEGFATFEIRASETAGEAMTLVSPDIATCPACRRELLDPADRRYRYPFTNCTNCGPRFTIIADVPYDRPATTMRDFPMCDACQAEYDDPSDRRFHAQPNACPVCGPRLSLNLAGRAPSGWEWDRAQEKVPRPHRVAETERRRTDDIVQAVAAMLLGGDVVAIKGLGGFHLACDATDESAVARLRDRKRRWGKPFAVMFPTLDDVRACCDVSDEEAALLEGSVRPIVLLRRKDASPSDRLAPLVAPGLAEVGVMLPYTPLHQLLLAAVRTPLVMTSGNVSDEPIETDNAEALRRLGPLADGFMLHDRDVYSRYDDSVVRVVDRRAEMVRRSRGYAPFPLRLPQPGGPSVLAAGPEQKNTFCLTKGEYAFVSQHIGDMENAETMEHYELTLALYERLFRITPELVAYDLHPEYLSTKYALGLGLPAVGVQHHHAHIASVAGEHGVSDTVVGVAFDGTGYGEDGTIWGGEVLLSTPATFERFAHLRCVPMPGGSASIRRPARMALGLLLGLDRGLLDHPGLQSLHARLTTDELATIPAMVDRGVNSPLTSSMGRLFDAVASLIGVRDDALYEGQAAIELEAIADPSESGSYRFGLLDGSPLIIDPLPVVEGILDDLAHGLAAPAISARFHRAVIDATVTVAQRAAKAAETHRVVLSGGVFMNRLLMSGSVQGLSAAGLDVLLPIGLPVNDGGISFGQSVVALSRADTDAV